MKRILLPVLCSISLIQAFSQNLLTFTSQRPPQLDVAAYKSVAIGNITGPLGSPTELSMDVTDALSSRLFGAQTLEVVDKGTLDKVLGDQRFNDLQVIDGKTTQELNRKLGNSLLITGRLQSSSLEQKLIYEDQSIVLNGCNRQYYYQVKGSAVIQLKIFDVRTGRLIFNDAISRPVDKKTKTSCEIPMKLDVGEIGRQTAKDLSEDIAALITPSEYKQLMKVESPGLLKSPFKKLDEAVSLMQAKSYDAGLAILKGYTEDQALKSKFKAPAYYNYGLGLLCAGQLDEAKTSFEKSLGLNSSYAPTISQLLQLIETEKQAAQKMARLDEDRKKAREEQLAEAAAPKNQPAKTGAAKPAAAKPKAKAKGF